MKPEELVRYIAITICWTTPGLGPTPGAFARTPGGFPFFNYPLRGTCGSHWRQFIISLSFMA